MTTEAPIVIQGTADLARLIQEQDRLQEQVKEVAAAYGVAESRVRAAQAALQRQERAAQRAAQAEQQRLREVAAAERQAAAEKMRTGQQIQRLTEQSIRLRERERRAAASAAQAQRAQGVSALRGFGGAVFGGAVNDINDIVGATAALGPAALAAGAGMVALAGGFAAVAGVSYAFYDLVLSTNANIQAIRGYEQAGIVALTLTEEQRRGAQDLDDALSLLGIQMSALSAEIGGRYAPKWADLALAISAGVDAAIPFAGQMASMAVGAQRAGAAVATFGISELPLVRSATLKAADALGVLIERQRETARAAAEVAEAERQAARLSERLAQRATQAVEKAARDAEQRQKNAAAEARRRAAQAVQEREREQRAIEQIMQGAQGAAYGDFERGREEQMREGARLQAEQERQDQAAAAAAAARSAELIRQREAEAEATKAATRAQQDYIVAGVQGVADLIEAAGAGAGAVRAAQLVATLAYQATAFARSVAELGPIAGIPTGLAIAGSIAGYIAQAREASQSHMGSGGRQLSQGPGAPDEETVRIRRSQSVVSGVDLQRREDAPIVIALDNQMFEAAAQRSTRVSRLYGRKGRAS